MKNSFKLISIDLDGTITQVVTEEYVLRKLAPEKLSIYQKLEDMLNKNESKAEEIIKKQFELLIGLNEREIKKTMREIPLTKNIKKAIEKMKEDGLIVIILTDNIDVFCEAIMDMLPLDYAVCSETIRMNKKIIKLGKLNTRKEEGLKDFLKQHNISAKQCIHIGDWRNDIPVFKIVGLGVAFLPKDQRIIKYATLTFNINDFLLLYKTLQCIIK